MVNPKNLRHNNTPSENFPASWRVEPLLPTWLSELLASPWNPTASLAVDRWLWYCQQEFEGLGGESDG